MKSVSRKRWPKWIAARLDGRKNVEVKENNGNYYLYGYVNTWNKKKKTPVKKGRYLGVLKEKTVGRALEHGHVKLLHHVLQEIMPRLKECFPKSWQYLTAFALNRVINPMPLKRMGSWYEKTSLPRIIGLDRVTSKTMAKTLDRAGADVSACSDFMQSLIKAEEMLLYDGSVIHSFSKKNKLLELGYDKDNLFLPKAGVCLLFSRNRHLPVYFKVFFGSVHEVRTLKEVVDGIKSKEIIFVGDKGYYQNALFEKLDANGIQFIIPLPRDDKRIRYERELDSVMEFNKRIIKASSYKEGGYWVYAFEDLQLKSEETQEYYRIKLNKQVKKEVTFHENWAGRIALISNIEETPQNVFTMWKSRSQIEKAFHVLQNILDLDRPYVSKEDTFKGYVFASFISLYAYYKVMNLLISKNINSKVSVEDAVFELSKVMIYEKNGLSLEIPKRTQKLVDLLELNDIIVKTGES